MSECSRLASKVLLLAVLSSTCIRGSLFGEENWPAWGGPSGTSHTQETGLPLSWSNDNVLWRVDLKGSGSRRR